MNSGGYRIKKKIKIFFQLNVFPFIINLFVRFLYISCKKRFFYPKINQNEAYVIAFWHGNLLMQPFNHKHLRPNKKGSVIISEHRDGITIARVMKFLGIDTISGSSTRGGAKALINAIKNIKNGIDVAITPDGPKGPKYSIADGIIVLAQKTKAKIITFHFEADKFWKMKSWDSFLIPKPFSTISFYASEPFSVEGLSIEEAKKILKKNMKEY